MMAVHVVSLLVDTNESGSFGEFLQLFGASVSTSRSHSTQHVQDGMVNVASVWNGDGLAFAGSVFSHGTMMLLHGSVGAHAVEQLELFAVLLDHFSAALVVSGKESANHNKISSSSDRFGHISRIGDTSVRHNMSIQTVSSIGTFENGRQLRVPNTSLLASGTDGSWSNTNLKNRR